MSKVTVHTTEDCDACDKALDLITSYEVEVVIVDVTDHKTEFGLLPQISFPDGETLFGFQVRRLKKKLRRLSR